MLDLVRENQGTGIQLFILVAGHSEARVHDANIAAFHVLDDQVQAVQSGTQRQRLLINGRKLHGLLEERVWKILADGIFKGLYGAAGQRADTPENVHRSGVHTVLGFELQLVVGNLHRDGHQNSVARYFHEIGAIREMELIAHHPRSHQRFQVLVLYIRRPLHLGVEFEPGELVQAGWCSAHGRRKSRAIGAAEPVGFRCHAHGFQIAQAGVGNIGQGVLLGRIHGHVIFARTAGIHKLQHYVFLNPFQIPVSPCFPRIRRRRPATFVLGAIPGAAGGV